jgi:signal transduction histidine kinase
MDLKPLSLLIAALANFALATYVLLKNPKKIVNISFGLFVFSVVLWSLAIFIINIGKDHEMLAFASRATFFGGAMMACNFLMFACVFPEIAREPISKKVLFRIYIPGGLAAVAAFTPLVWEGIEYVGGRVRPIYGKGIILYTIYCIAFTGYGLFLLAQKYVKHPGRFERVQLKYTFWGLLIPIVGVVLITLVLPQVGISRFSDLTPLLTVVGVGTVSYAIVRYRLMDLGVVFRNVLIYACTALMMTIVLIGLLLFLEPILRLPLRSAVLLAAACAAILIQPMRYYMETLVDKHFFHGRYNYKAALAEFSASMTRILDLEDLQNRIVSEVSSILQVKSATLLLWDAAENRYSIRSSVPHELNDTMSGIGPDSDVLERMKKERLPLVKGELKRILPHAEFGPLEREFERIEAEVFVPLISRGELIGLLSLGEKVSADIYSTEDVNLLATLGNQAAVALEDALLHHAVTMLKNHNDNILKFMSSGVIAINTKQLIDTCNEKAREILRLPAQGVIKWGTDVLPPPLHTMLADTLGGGITVSNQEVQILSEGGAISYLNASTSLIRGERDEVTGVLLVFNDLTDIKLLESEMWRADKLASLGTLAAGMAHEIKNPLVSIRTFAQLLPTKYEDKEFRDTFSSITVDEVERINSIVEKLLEFARPSAPLFESVNVIGIIEEVLTLLNNEMKKLGITLKKNFEVPSAPIVGDKSQLKQALLNLCLNSLQAIESRGDVAGREIAISVGLRKARRRDFEGSSLDEIAQMYYGTEITASADDAETVVVRVSDTGRGISREDLVKIFDPFFTTRERGMGLGLAVVHGIIREHSGNIYVDSKENVGTEFVVSLPVTQIFAREKV